MLDIKTRRVLCYSGYYTRNHHAAHDISYPNSTLVDTGNKMAVSVSANIFYSI